MGQKHGEQSREEKIRRTIAEFTHFADAGDFDGWVRLFTNDGSYHMFGHSHTGPEALRAFIEDDQPPHRRGLHLTSDSIIEFDEDAGVAKVRSKFLFVAAGDLAGMVVAGGMYHDILVPCGDRWLFKEREAVLFASPAMQGWGPKDSDEPNTVPWYAVTRATPVEQRGAFKIPGAATTTE